VSRDVGSIRGRGLNCKMRRQVNGSQMSDYERPNSAGRPSRAVDQIRMPLGEGEKSSERSSNVKKKEGANTAALKGEERKPK